MKKQGYATNDSELDPDVFSACAPVFFAHEIAGALGFAGPRERLAIGKKAQLPGILATLQEEAGNLSALMTEGLK